MIADEEVRNHFQIYIHRQDKASCFETIRRFTSGRDSSAEVTDSHAALFEYSSIG